MKGAERRVRGLTEGVAEAEGATEHAPLLAALRTEGKRLEGFRAALARAEAAPSAGSPATILEEAQRRVDALRAALAGGGAEAAVVVEAVLGGEKFVATREGDTWRLTARGSLGGVFEGSSGTAAGGCAPQPDVAAP